MLVDLYSDSQVVQVPMCRYGGFQVLEVPTGRYKSMKVVGQLKKGKIGKVLR